MKQINFDQIIDRSKSGAICYDGLNQYFGRNDLLPLWIADMDFATPSFIIDALRKRLEHPILGYTQEPEAYRQAIIDWVASHHQWKIEREWIRYIPGIVRGIGTVINAMTMNISGMSRMPFLSRARIRLLPPLPVAWKKEMTA